MIIHAFELQGGFVRGFQNSMQYLNYNLQLKTSWCNPLKLALDILNFDLTHEEMVL